MGKHLQRFSKSRLAAVVTAAALGLGYASIASADLIFINESNETGEGYGNVINILSMHKSGGAGTAADVESGKVAWNGSADVITPPPGPTSYVLTDPNKTATHTFGALSLSGATAASDLRLIWDPAETGNAAGDDTQVDTLILSIYAPNGSLLFTASLASPVNHDHVVGPGLGVGDFVYGLDSTQAATLQVSLTAIGDFSLYRIGLESSVSFVDDGPDTWLVAKANSGPCVPTQQNNNCGGGGGGGVPEPATLALVGLGLFGAALSRKRRPN